jgi:hypothetical protein
VVGIARLKGGVASMAFPNEGQSAEIAREMEPRKERVMKKAGLILLSVSLLLIFGVGTALAIGLPGGLPGKSNLKKETKSFKLGDVSADLKAFEGTDFDPGKAKPFACNVFGDQEYDTVAIAVTKIDLVTQFAQNVLKDANPKIDAAKEAKDLDAAKKNLEAAQKAAQALAADGAKLTASATSLISNLPGKAKSDPLGYGANLADMTGVAKKVPDLVGKTLPDTIKQLTDTLTKLTEKAKTFAPK